MTAPTTIGWPTPAKPWPDWLWNVPYDASRHPGAPANGDLRQGANCQRFAYEVLRLFDISVPPHRSSELCDDPRFLHPDVAAIHPLDLVLFNAEPRAWGGHLAIYMDDDQLLHLCAEVGRPAVWSWADFASRPRYRTLVEVIRPISGSG